MKKILGVVLLYLFFASLPAQEVNENAKKYLSILKSKPTPGFMFDRFYGVWMESSDTKGLEEYLKKLSIDEPTSEQYLLLAFYYPDEKTNNTTVNDNINNN